MKALQLWKMFWKELTCLLVCKCTVSKHFLWNHTETRIQKPFCSIGCSEKGWVSVRLTVNSSGGHSSMPEAESSLSILANAVTRYFHDYWLYDKTLFLFFVIYRLTNSPHPSRLGSGPETAMFEHIAHEVHDVIITSLNNRSQSISSFCRWSFRWELYWPISGSSSRFFLGAASFVCLPPI